MDIMFWIVVVLAATLAGAAWHAYRHGSERRNVALLGICAGSLGAISAFVASS